MFHRELVTIVFCVLIKTCFSQIMPTQGIEGYVYRVAGNQMPSPSRKKIKPKGFQTALYVFQLTSLAHVERQEQSSFYSSIKTRFVAKAETDSSGFFKINLPPGHYSLFVKKGDLFFSNRFDQNNNIAPVEVLPQKFSKVEFTVDYDAVY